MDYSTASNTNCILNVGPSITSDFIWRI